QGSEVFHKNFWNYLAHALSMPSTLLSSLPQRTITDLNSFMNELMEVFEKLNAMHKKHSYTLKGSLMLKDDINRYIYMRESERSNIRVQHIPNSYPGNIHNSRERFY
ncbi:conserved Plasmodium protein, unknown function, partial [Plasmodium ovale curtisi]